MLQVQSSILFSRRSPGEPSTSSPSPSPDLRPTADLYRQEVKRQIAEVELKLAVLESDRAEKMEGRDPTAGEGAAEVTVQALEERIHKARDVLARLRLVEWKIQGEQGSFWETALYIISRDRRVFSGVLF